MSFHYTVCISTQLRRNLAEVDFALLDYVFNMAADPPTLEANDPLRSAVLKMDWLRKWFDHGADRDRASDLQATRLPEGGFLSVQLAVFSPGYKLESIYEDWPPVLRWLATLIATDGHFATVICEDGGERSPDLYYAYEGKLYLKSDQEPNVALAYDSDQRREIRTR